MPDTSHDPPKRYAVIGPRIPAARLAVLNGSEHVKYEIMKHRLGCEPLDVIADMRNGFWKGQTRRIGGVAHPVVDEGGTPVGDRMSFRRIAPELVAMTGVSITYETLRRWWLLAFPEDAATVDVAEPEPVRPVKRTTTRRRPVPFGDLHAEAIRKATAKTASTNPDVPPATFLPPTE
jgi:hypothetical protein